MASLAIWLGTNRLALVWLQRLRTVAGRFAKGDFTGDQARFEGAPEEIATLSADLHSMAEVIDRRNRDLTQALEAKSMLTREVHHRVKNNLQIINSLLTLQSGRVPDGEVKDVLAQTRARISALALIHRVLYEQENGYEAGAVTIDTLMRELCAQLQSAAYQNSQPIKLHCRAESIFLPIDYAVPVTLFIVEAVTNAFRHAFTDGRAGEISLCLTKTGDGVELCVTDNGCGYAVNNGNMQMGTELMYGFTTQVNGSLSLSSEIGSGTRVSLTFPVSHDI
jgi:two-component sensor histidine kinase